MLVGALLAGIVALNVAALGLTMEGERLDARLDDLRTENARLLSELSSASAAGRIQAGASWLGLVPPVETRYIRLRPRP